MEKDGSDLEVIPDGVGSVKLDEPLAGVPTEKSFQEREKAFEARLSEMKDENKKLLDAFNKATAKTAESEKNLAEMQKILEASAKKDDNYAKVVEKIDELAKNTKAYSLEEAGWGDLKIKDIGKKLKYIWNRGPLANDIKMLQQQITDAQNQVNKIKLEADTPYRAAIISHTNQYIAKLRKDLQTCINHNRWHKHLFAVLKTAVKKGLKKLWSGTKSGIKAAPGKISEATKNAWGKYLSIRGTGPKVGGIPIY
jgi:chromosome segregation ATPase